MTNVNKWIDANGTLVYKPYGKSSAKRVLLTKEELKYTKMLLTGTVTKSGTVFIAPFTEIIVDIL